MARILVTRPEEDGAALADILAGLGHESLLEPLLSVRLRGEALDVAGAQALLFTSANGVRAAEQLIPGRDLPAYCVGDATARAAREAGFGMVESASGDVEALAALVCGRLSPGAGALVHVAGTVQAGDLSGSLEAAGFDVRRAVVYVAIAARRLSDAAREALVSGRIDAVALFSPRTARTFATIVADAGLGDAMSRIDLLCLSQAVADALEDLPRRKTLVAAEPTQTALLDLIR